MSFSWFPVACPFTITPHWKQSKHVPKPQFSSSYWGKQCSRSPRLSTYRFCVDWKQSKHVRKKQFFGAWKIVFPQSLSFLQVIGENNASGPHVYPHIDFARVGSSPSMCGKKFFFGAWKIDFLQSPISSHKTIRGHATKKNERQRGIANLTYTQ